MTTLGWVLIFVGVIVVHSVSNGRGITEIPKDIGALFTSVLQNDVDGARQILQRTTATGAMAPTSTTLNAADAFAQYRQGERDSMSRSYQLGNVDPKLNAIASEVGSKFGITEIGGYRATSTVAGSDHPKGKAIDIMCTGAKGDEVSAYIIANASRFGVKYLIWKQRSWNPSRGTWQGMADRGSPTANHMDHVHLSIN